MLACSCARIPRSAGTCCPSVSVHLSISAQSWNLLEKNCQQRLYTADEYVEWRNGGENEKIFHSAICHPFELSTLGTKKKHKKYRSLSIMIIGILILWILWIWNIR